MSHVPRSGLVVLLVGAGLLSAGPDHAHAQSFAVDSVPTFHLQGPTVRIGSDDDSAYAFGTVLGLAQAPDGSLYSIHSGEADVHRWTAGGKAAGTIGRRGRGPGEFTAPSDLGFFGDTLWVMDLFAHRASYFAPGGTFLGSVEPRVVIGPSPTNPAALMPHPMRPFRDGRWYGQGSGRAVDLASGRLSSVPFVAMDSTGAMLDTMWVLHYRPYDVLVVPLAPPRHYAYLGQPFGDRPLIAARGDGTLVIVDRRVQDGGGPPVGHFSVTSVDERGDTVVHATVSYRPVPLSPRRVGRVAIAMADEAYGPQNVARAGMTESKFEVEVAEKMFAPDDLPAVSNLVPGEDGSIWMRRFAPSEGQEEWWVLDPRGRPQRRVLAPVGLRVLWAGADHVWGVVSDSYGVDYIVRYDIQAGEGPVGAERSR